MSGCVRCGGCGLPLMKCTCERAAGTWLEREYEKADEANSVGICPGCEDRNPHVLCTTCGVCFKYCHPDDHHIEDAMAAGGTA